MSSQIAFYCAYDSRIYNDVFIDNYDNNNEYVRLTNQLRAMGYKLHTLDIYEQKQQFPDICIFLEVPTLNINKIIDVKKTKSIVLLREPSNMLLYNFDANKLQQFDLVLTWDNNLIDDIKYFFYPSARFNLLNKPQTTTKQKLCVLINSNLKSNIKGELYSHRLQAIKWFEKNYLKDFDLWGYGWDTYKFTLRSRAIVSSKLLAKKRISYQGIADDKLQTLSQYKFCICFENTSNIKDYISEKIFDSFLAQTIPIYWGAPNVSDVIPKECFVDFRDFDSYEELYSYIKNMSDDKYLEYINAINKYLNSKDAYKYTLDNWVAVVKNAIFKLENYND